MPLSTNQVITYVFSSILLALFINIVPAIQPIKYILFIILNFLLIILPINYENILKIKTFLSILIFIFIILVINFIPIKFSLNVDSFNKIDFTEISEEAKIFYEENFKFCYENKNVCFEKSNNLPKAKNIFFRNYLNINNINELRSNIYHSPHNAIIHQNEYINKYNYPFILTFEFPNLYKNSKLCYFQNSLENCKIIDDTKISYEVFGKGEKNIIFLDQNIELISIKMILSFFLISSFVYVLKNIYLFKIKNKFDLLYPLSIILILIIFSLTNIENINFLNSYFFQYPGGDGHLYLILANLIQESFLNFNYYEAFKGGNDVFYYMPGMRYFVAFEKLIYGNAYYLHLIILSFLPFIVKNLLSIYFSKKIVITLMLSFLFIPLMHHMGFSYFQFFRYFTKVFAEPIAYTIFLYAFYRLVLWFTNKDKFYDTLPLTCFLFSTSCILRPNLSSSSFFLLLIPLFYLARYKKYKYLFFYFLTGSIIFLPLFHNLYFGNKFVIFTDAVFSDANIKITIYDYLSIIMFDEISIYKKEMLYEMLGNFINPFEIHKYFILGMIVFSINIKNLKNSYLLPLYVLIFSQLYLFFFLNPGPRYMWIFWISSLILALKVFMTYREKKI